MKYKRKVKFLSIALASMMILSTPAFARTTQIDDDLETVTFVNTSMVLTSLYSGQLTIIGQNNKINCFDRYVSANVPFSIEECKSNSIYKAILKAENDDLFLGTLETKTENGLLIGILSLSQVDTMGRSVFSLIEFETETNNTIKKANEIKDNTIFGKIDKKKDKDFFKITFANAGDYAILLDEMPDRKDYDLAIYNQNGKQIGSSSTVNETEFVKIDHVKAGEIYYAEVSGYKNDFDKINTYRLQHAKFNYATDDHGNSFDSASSIDENSVSNGRIDFVNDVDYFKFTATKKGEYKIFTEGNTNTYGILYDTSQNKLAENKGSENWNFEISSDLAAEKTYYVAVKHHGTGTGAYVLNIKPPDGENPQQNIGNSIQNATPIETGSALSAWLESDYDKRYVSFVPIETGSYGFYSEGDCDTYGTLITENSTKLIENDKGIDDKNFIVANTLEAGKKYYVEISTKEANEYNKIFEIYAKRYDEPSDNLFNQQWHLLNKENANDINILPIWDYYTGSGVKVGVADTGTDISHIDLKSNILTDMSFNFIHGISDVFPINENPTSSSAVSGHGTHVAGIIGASNNGIGTIGVSPNTSLISLKVLGSTLSGYPKENDIVASIKAVEHAQNNGIQIINMSLGGSEYSESEHLIMQQTDDILFVIAAGNNGRDISKSPMYPACYYLENSIVVANSNMYGELSSTSNYGGPTHIAAPGTNIMSTMPFDTHRAVSGTSMAAPVVAGVAALVKEKYPSFTPIQIRNRITSNSNVNSQYSMSGKVSSSGIVNAFKAVMNDEISYAPYSTVIDANQRQIMSLSVKDRIKQTKANADPDSFTKFVILKTNSNVNLNEFLVEIQRDHKFTKLELNSELSIIDCYVVECESKEEASRAVDILNEYNEMVYAEPDYIRDISE